MPSKVYEHTFLHLHLYLLVTDSNLSFILSVSYKNMNPLIVDICPLQHFDILVVGIFKALEASEIAFHCVIKLPFKSYCIIVRA